jgi:hypothetical protein
VLLLLTQCDGCKRREYQQHEFPSTLVVDNHTHHNYVDTMSMIILNKIFNIDTVNLAITYTPSHLFHPTHDIQGFIYKCPPIFSCYTLFMRERGLTTSIKRLIAHEMIHVNQMERGELVIITDTLVVYLGDTINLLKTPYEQRRFEIDARRAEKSVLRELNALLYK